MDILNEIKNRRSCRSYKDSIPSKEELVVIGIGDHDEVFDRESLIIWTIPRRFIDQYRKDIKNGNNRLIGLHKEEKVDEVSRTIK